MYPRYGTQTALMCTASHVLHQIPLVCCTRPLSCAAPDHSHVQGAGLSSSSALVCCAALATAHANAVTFSKVCHATILLLAQYAGGVCVLDGKVRAVCWNRGRRVRSRLISSKYLPNIFVLSFRRSLSLIVASMDQSISFLGEADTAKFIEFNPGISTGY